MLQVSDRAFTGLQESAATRQLSQPAQDILWPTLGGLGTGLIALAYPEVLYQGFGNVNAILEARGSDYAPAVLLQIVAAKVVTTCLCQRSGLVGGIYAPSIFMGACLPLPLAQAAACRTDPVAHAPVLGVAHHSLANRQQRSLLRKLGGNLKSVPAYRGCTWLSLWRHSVSGVHAARLGRDRPTGVRPCGGGRHAGSALPGAPMLCSPVYLIHRLQVSLLHLFPWLSISIAAVMVFPSHLLAA